MFRERAPCDWLDKNAILLRWVARPAKLVGSTTRGARMPDFRPAENALCADRI